MPEGPSGNLLIHRRGSAVRGWIILGACVVLFVAVAVWFLLVGREGWTASVAVGAMCVGGVMFAAILGAILTDSPIRSVARYTFVQCLRTKLTAVFIVLIGIALAAVYHVEGDGTLGGRIRNFLSYSNGITSLLLSVMTLFLSISVVARDVQTRQIFTLATKPLARWEYIVGRWLGVVLLDAGLVLVAGVVIYGLAQYLRGKGDQMDFADRRTVETEVFTARKRVPPDPLPLERWVEARLRRMREQGLYDSGVDTFLAQAGGDREVAARLLIEQIAKQMTEDAQSLGPRQRMQLRFSGIEADSTEVTGKGRIVAVNRRSRLARVKVTTRILGHLRIGAPLKIGGVRAYVYRVGKGLMDVWFAGDDEFPAKIVAMASDKDDGEEVPIVLVSAIQLVYKVKMAGKPVNEELLRGSWLMVNPKTGQAESERPHKVPLDALQTFTVSAGVVSADGRTRALYANLSPSKPPVSVVLNRDDIAVLYRVGGFGWNLTKGMGLVLFRCAYLAGLGLLASSFLSFPVACLVCFVLFVIAQGRGFMTKAVVLSRSGGDDLLTFVGHYVMRAMSVVLPDFARSSPVDSLVDGMYISWGFFGETLIATVAFRGMIVLVLACLIFRRRELARVQV